ncbi:FAD-linked oxidase C-terminal domain-containing protein [Nonomuraea sp. NPDC050404]|uniref:FAD-binding oxidoreductase n=1 Tax=Nonomuraea sp. NPDC050404 TaxID=3155783 RepID=UPI0033CFA28D
MELIDRLAAELPDGRVISDPDVIDSYRQDRLPLPAGQPLGVVCAKETADVVATLRWASAHRVPVVPRGAGTGLVGGAAAVTGGIVLSLAGMRAIRELSPADQLAVAEAGVVNADLDRAARRHGLMYAPDPSSYEMCTIGGNVATNAGGLRCVKYGVTKDAVLGLEVVLADGRVLSTGARTVKHVTGYDLTSLFVGSEGTLGVVTAATLRLRPVPGTVPATLTATFTSLRAAAEAVSAIMAAGIEPSLLELLDRATLRAVDDWKNIGLDDNVQAMLLGQADSADAESTAKRMARLCAGASDVVVTTDPEEAAQLIGLRRLTYLAGERLGACFAEDVCVPRSRLPEAIELVEAAAARHDVHIMSVAHAGDGNLHPLFVYDREATRVPDAVWAAADEIFRGALALGGTLTGEHGVGTLKRRWLELELGADGLDVHRAIKSALDPLGVLNPGKAL